MFSRVFSGNITGVDASLVCVEADVAGGLPQFNMVGLLSSEVREAKERVVRAFSNSEIEIPARKITVNLSPAGMKKQGSGFDLAIAVSILTALGIIREDSLKGCMFVGELSLDGQINKVNGILPIALMARKEGFQTLIVPEKNAFEGAVIDGLNVSGVKNLRQLMKCLNQNCLPKAEPVDLEQKLQSAYYQESMDFMDIKGQENAKRATMIAVAGFHNLLYIGPPGSGKSMMAKRIPTILSRLSREECLEISKIYSVMGLLPEDSLLLKRPFRNPHHSITGPSLVGGMGNPRPGEITLAHKGILFLDEAAEFKKDVIEMLRQPLEDKKVVISRLSGNVIFPADFMLVMAMNPCRCGYYPDKQHCSCSQAEVNHYFGKIKGPILDRIDICVGTRKLSAADFLEQEKIGSVQMREKIFLAQELQRKRFEGKKIRFNSQMNRKEIEDYCQLDPAEQKILEKAYEKYNMTARSYYKVLKVARTIADLENEAAIGKTHLLEALGYRNIYGE